MKPIIFATTLGLLLFTVSCEKKPSPAVPVPEVHAADLSNTVAPEIGPDVELAVREKGNMIVAQAFGALSSRLGKAIAESGHTNAIEFCSVHGIPLTMSVGVTNDVIIRRVTHRPRNPLNRADVYELAIIRQMEAEQRESQPAKPVIRAHNPDTLTYYAPIMLNLPLCITCHGDPDKDIKPDVLAELARLYPTDEATGFKQGQLRGLWSVEFKRSEFASPVDSEAGK